MSKDLLVSPSRLLASGKQIQSSWSSPPPGVLKVNVDASFMPSLGSTAVAMVGQNFNGEVCFGKTWFCMAISPLMAKTIALLKAAQFVGDMGVHYVVVESNNQELISCLQQPNKPLSWEAKSIIKSIRRLCNPYPEFLFSFVSGEGNQVVD
ncbi:hypothetical protein SLE2022_295310 [Rubroshorea leprosula]